MKREQAARELHRGRRRQRDVLRNRAGKRALRQRASRRRSADLRGARLRRGARSTSRCWSIPWSASSGRSISTTASRSSAPGLEDHFCGKLLGLPMGCDVCYTNHAEADQDDMDALLTLLGVAGRELHHGRARRRRRDAALPEHLLSRCAVSAPVLGLRPAPEFEAWLEQDGHCGRARPSPRKGAEKKLLPGASEWLK